MTWCWLLGHKRGAACLCTRCNKIAHKMKLRAHVSTDTGPSMYVDAYYLCDFCSHRVDAPEHSVNDSRGWGR
jgi:hypothetical protein